MRRALKVLPLFLVSAVFIGLWLAKTCVDKLLAPALGSSSCLFLTEVPTQPHLATQLRRDPLRMCWRMVADSGNQGPEQCMTDAAFHKLEMGLPIDHEPVVALWKDLHMSLVDGGPVVNVNLEWKDLDGEPVKLCWHSTNQVTGWRSREECRTKMELLGDLEQSEQQRKIAPEQHPSRGPL